MKQVIERGCITIKDTMTLLLSEKDIELVLTEFWIGNGNGTGREKQVVVIDESEWPVFDMAAEEHVKAETTWTV